MGHGDALAGLLAGRTSPGGRRGRAGRHRPGARIVLPYLRERGIRRLDAVALSHPHPDHALGLLTVLREIPADRLWLPAGVERGPLVEALSPPRVGRGSSGSPPETGARWAGPGARSLAAADASALRTVNDRSLVLHLDPGQSVLLPGDAGAAAEAGCRLSPARGEGAAPWVPDLELAPADLPARRGWRSSRTDAAIASACPHRRWWLAGGRAEPRSSAPTWMERSA